MIRAVAQNDSEAIIDVSVAAGLFPPEDRIFLDEMMANFFDHNRAAGHRCIIDVDGDVVNGVAYYEPALATDRTWYLTMIGVRREHQGQGRGAALMNAIEQELQVDGQRILLVETSGSPDFTMTRKFYAKLGYEEEACVRDYFALGDDMVLFRKVLSTD